MPRRYWTAYGCGSRRYYLPLEYGRYYACSQGGRTGYILCNRQLCERVLGYCPNDYSASTGAYPDYQRRLSIVLGYGGAAHGYGGGPRQLPLEYGGNYSQY
jgi:hypothetical protein